MALDVGMLDRQYRKLTDRQKQAHIVVGGTWPVNHLAASLIDAQSLVRAPMR